MYRSFNLVSGIATYSLLELSVSKGLTRGRPGGFVSRSDGFVGLLQESVYLHRVIPTQSDHERLCHRQRIYPGRYARVGTTTNGGQRQMSAPLG